MDNVDQLLEKARAKLAQSQPQGGMAPVPAPQNQRVTQSQGVTPMNNVPMPINQGSQGMMDYVGKAQANSPVYMPFAPGTLTGSGKQLRENQRQFNIDVARDVSKEYGVPVSPKESLDNVMAQVRGLKPLDVMRDERNFNRGVLESDRNFNRGVLESDRSYNYNVDRDREMDGRYYEERDYQRDWNEDERDYRRDQDGESFLSDEVSGLRQAILGGMSADQALSQIETDMRNGLYSPEQARVLQNVANNMKSYGDSQKRAQIDLTLSQMTPQNTSAEEAKAAIAKLGILSPTEQMKLNQEIDTMWKQAAKNDPGVMDKIKGALSGGTWNNTVGTAAAGIMTVKTLIDNIFHPKPQP